MAQNETDLWTLNRLACGPRTGFQIGHFRFFLASLILLETPIFIVFLYRFQFEMLKCWHTLVKISDPQKPIEQGSARFVVPEPALKMGPRNQAKTKKKETTKKCDQHKTKRFFLQNGAFSDKKKLKMFFFLWHWAAGFSVAKDCNDNSEKHYKTRGFVVFVVVFMLLVVAPTATT